MASRRHLKIKTIEENCKALKNLEIGMSKKDVSEKHGVPKNTLYVAKKYRKDFVRSGKVKYKP